MNQLQRSATNLAKRARQEAEVWDSVYALFAVLLTVATGLASFAFWGAIR